MIEVFKGFIDPIAIRLPNAIFTIGTPRIWVRIVRVIYRPEEAYPLPV